MPIRHTPRTGEHATISTDSANDVLQQRSGNGFSRRTALAAATGLGASLPWRSGLAAAKRDPAWNKALGKGLNWVAKTQSNLGHWTSGNPGPYPTAMTALAATSLICAGATTTQGPFARNIRRAVDFLVQKKARPNGLIGDPLTDNRYTYGHGFSMLFLSQVLGEEEDRDRRSELIDVLTRAVEFSVRAQTKSGGWGYVSAKDGNNFDEGSTTITQVQGLRGCRNAGIGVPTEAIEQAKNYIYRCKNKDGGISYSSRNRGSSRPAITAAALASLYNAGDYESPQQKQMYTYCKKTLHNIKSGSSRSFGHWHYTYLYYSQVVYRQGGAEWIPFRDNLFKKIVREQNGNGSWSGNIGPIYVTACNLIMMQLDQGYLPIYQR